MENAIFLREPMEEGVSRICLFRILCPVVHENPLKGPVMRLVDCVLSRKHFLKIELSQHSCLGNWWARGIEQLVEFKSNLVEPLSVLGSHPLCAAKVLFG